MTRTGVSGYIEAMRQRCRRANKGAKGKILDEATEVTGYDRRALIGLLGAGHGRGAARRCGRPPVLWACGSRGPQPVMKLQHETRHGAKVHKVYDTAKTPYHGLLERG